MSAQSDPGRPTTDVMLDQLDEDECLRLISPGGIGRIAFTGQYDLTVLPVNYKMHDGMVLFRMSQQSLTAEDLRTGFPGSEYRIAFEVDEFDHETREGWSVLLQGPAHHLDDDAERAEALAVGVDPWPGGERDHFISVKPMRVSGRRIRRITR